MVYKSDWTDADEMEGMCESLVRNAKGHLPYATDAEKAGL